jgi:L-alanine-DL-glutamate epimerase-like enolase superfamily enzyme
LTTSRDSIRLFRAEAFELDLGAMPVPFSDSTMGPFTHWKMPWLRLTADDGVVGEAPAGLHAVVRPSLLTAGGSAGLTPAEWQFKLYWMLRNNGHRSPDTSGFLYGFDVALRDILARRAGLPWHRYMGAARDVVPVYGSGGSTGFSEEQLVAEMRSMVAGGFRTVKMKVAKDFGRRMDEDVARVKAVREAIGGSVELAVDANQAWGADQAALFARRIADQNIAWFEEPVQSADRHALRDICRACPFPVAMGESENSVFGYRDLYECGVRHIQPHPGCLPGFDPWRGALAWAEKSGEAWTAGGYSHLTAMFVATQATGTVEYLRSIIGHLATCWSEKPLIEKGSIRLPGTPGLPTKVDWDELRRKDAVRVLADDRA